MAKRWTTKPQSWNPGRLHLTEEGLQAMQKRYSFLLNEERPHIAKEVGIAAAHGDRSENAEYLYGKKRLREIDREIYELQKKLENVEVVYASQFPTEYVGFGSVVVLADEDGETKTVQIVGVDESDTVSGRISLLSPLAKALIKKKVGDVFLFRPPKGEIEYEILEIKASWT